VNATVAGFVRRESSAAVEIVSIGGRLPQSAEYLHLAGDRWLWLDPAAERLAEFANGGLVIVDVDGKWAVYDAGADVARRILNAAVDLDEILDGRDCAAVTLFDCPAVVARPVADRIVVCVHASYAASFELACAASQAAGTATRDRSVPGPGANF
jgi:hypothetical protein